MVNIISSDNISIDFPLNKVVLSDFLANAYENSYNNEIVLPNINGRSLVLVYQFLCLYTPELWTSPTQPLYTNKLDHIIDPWCIDYLNSINDKELIDLLLATNYLNIKPLYEIISVKIMANVKGKTIEEIREIFEGIF